MQHVRIAGISFWVVLLLITPFASLSAADLPWAPAQATGAPNSLQAGDQQTAWASLGQNKGPEWLKLEYVNPVEAKTIRIHENFNPGAISKVTGFDETGTETVLWEGTEPVKTAPNIFEVKPETPLVTKSIKIYLDTRRAKGWNEIDAVELVGADDSRQWASKATASSTYASRSNSGSRRSARPVTWETLSPSVVKTIPQSGSTDVDPGLKELRVTFSKNMLTERMWAVVQVSKAHYPQVKEGIHYLDDQRTCVIPVDLEPDKLYVLWFNLGRYNSFRDTENNPAVPYQLVFKTRAK